MVISITTLPKDPDSYLDYGLDWSEWLASGEQLTCSFWTILPSGTLTGNTTTTTTSISLVWLSGGTPGATYTAKNRIGTSDGRITDRTISIKVLER